MFPLLKFGGDMLNDWKSVAVVGVVVVVLAYGVKKVAINTAGAVAGAVGDAAGGAVEYAKDHLEDINPVNDGNIFNRAAESVAEAVIGTPDIGGWIYNKFH